MVFKPINLARQSFVKTFTHGYAQSLVAASQSSSASHNTSSFHALSSNVTGIFNKSGQTTTHASQNASHANTGHGGSISSTKGGHSDVAGHQSGLDAYYAAWQSHQSKSDDKEWHQFQFAKRIGWKAPTTIPENQLKVKTQVRDEAERPRRGTLVRARSTSAIDDIINARDGHTAIASEVQDSVTKDVDASAASQAASASLATDLSSATMLWDVDESLSATPSFTGSTSTRAPSTPATSVSEIDQYVAQLSSLAEKHQYSDIPAVFEFMLNAGVKPTASGYNALLLAAINLPRGRHQVVPKVLDVYSDMLRRRVTPNTSTYAILIELLAARALDVGAMKNDLTTKRSRYGTKDTFMFKSDETEFEILAEDDSISLAVKLFDTAAAVSSTHVFSAETYRLLLSACAQQGRINDMVRIYANMESQTITPPTAIFAPMIEAFATTGDLRSAVECYDEYKSLAIDHDAGRTSIVRKDDEIYAAIVKAYSICGQMQGGLKFLGKVEEALLTSDDLPMIRDTVAMKALHPAWLSKDRYEDVVEHTLQKLSAPVRAEALTAACLFAADRNHVQAATHAFQALIKETLTAALAEPAIALMAMHIRNSNNSLAASFWKSLESSKPANSLIEPGTMYATFLIQSGNIEAGLKELRNLFVRVRSANIKTMDQPELQDRMEEAIAIVHQRVLETTPVPMVGSCLELLKLMSDNDSMNADNAQHLLAGFGPHEISTLVSSSISVLLTVEAEVLFQQQPIDHAHAARFAHLVEMSVSLGLSLKPETSKLVDAMLRKLNRPNLSALWHGPQFAPAASMVQSSPYAPFSPRVPVSVRAPFEDNYDPYMSTTDFKGSNTISEELEKTYGRHANHLDEALVKFKNIRRAGRHPRYVTYAKLINAAAKEHRLSLAQDILAMAKQDMPLIMQSRVVRHGWVSIWDAMVGACLTVGARDLAAQFHQDLNSIGAAPSANTFGLYITTLKESTKTFDEASEAVKIFQRAKSEGVDPSSFLYNALIGKLGKARRIDDCLLYFAEMRNRGIRPTSVTYGTIVNALCRVSDDKFAEELFEEMESMPNYKPRPAPYNSLMQYFLTTKRDRSKVLAYYDRMLAKRITPTMHTYKLLIDTYATLEPIDMPAAEAVLDFVLASGSAPEAVHYASLIHAKGCVQHDMAGARGIFDRVMKDRLVAPQASLYQALFESLVANDLVTETEPLLAQMVSQGVRMTAYIANTLIHGWSCEGQVDKARKIYEELGRGGREPSTYEAMIRAYLTIEEKGLAKSVVGEALRRGYPSAVSGRICDLVGGGAT